MSLRRVLVSLVGVVVVVAAGVTVLNGWSFDFDESVVVTFANDTTHKLTIGLCTDETCRSGSREYADGVKPGRSVEERVGTGNGVNAFIVTGPSGDKVGCFLLRYQHKLTGKIVYKLSQAVPCPSS